MDGLRIICKKKFGNTKQLFQPNKILKSYKLNIFNVSICDIDVYKVNETAPNVFISTFQKQSHFYPTRYLKRANTLLQLEDHISGIAFLTLRKNLIEKHINTIKM